MEKKEIIIDDFEDKKSKAGKRYTRFKTQLGWMSAFDKEVIEPLKELEGKKALCEIAIDQEKGFKNIRGFIKEVKASDDSEELQISEERLKEPKKEKDFHLTDEAVRIGALESAIKVTKKLDTDDYKRDLFNNFKEFEKWILTGEKA
jgi:hypothetical protein